MSERLFTGGVEERKLKRKILEEPPTMDRDSEVLLSLSLGGGNNMAGQSSSKFTFKYMKGCADSGFAPKPVENPNDQEVTRPMQRQFPCKFCNKKFRSSQALGGHQNAHRRERALSRMGKVFNMGTFGLGAALCPYSAMANQLPFRGSPLYEGAHMHPMAHMPAMPCPSFGPSFYGNQGMNSTPRSSHQIGLANCWYIAGAKNPQSFNNRDAGFGYELAQFPSPGLGGLLGNNHTGNQQFPSLKHDLSPTI